MTTRHYFYDFMFILVLIFSFILFFRECNKQDNPIIDIESHIVDTFTCANFTLELHKQGIQCSDVVLRQACLESGYFKSDVWKKNNNPFGFCYKDCYLQFDTWQESIKYMKDWQGRWYKQDEDYYSFLQRLPYAMDSLYVKKLKSINLNNLK